MAIPHRCSHSGGEVVCLLAGGIGSERQPARSGQRRQIGGGLSAVPRHLGGPELYSTESDHHQGGDQHGRHDSGDAGVVTDPAQPRRSPPR